MKYLKLYYRSNPHTYYRSALAEEHFLLIWMIWSTNSECQIKCCLLSSCVGIFCDFMDCAPLSKGFLQARMLEWVAISFSRGSSQSRDWTCISCIGRWILYHWATRGAQIKVLFSPRRIPYILVNRPVLLHSTVWILSIRILGNVFILLLCLSYVWSPILSFDPRA